MCYFGHTNINKGLADPVLCKIISTWNYEKKEILIKDIWSQSPYYNSSDRKSTHA